MGEQHLDLLALTAADREFFGVGQVPRDLPGIFIHVAGHGPGGSGGAGFPDRAGATGFGVCAIALDC